MSISELLNHRLSSLGCERLPVAVVKVLRERIEEANEKSLVRIIERTATASKIAKIFVQELGGNSAKSHGGCKGERAAFPFDQADPLVLPPQNETESVAGTTTLPPQLNRP